MLNSKILHTAIIISLFITLTACNKDTVKKVLTVGAVVMTASFIAHQMEMDQQDKNNVVAALVNSPSFTTSTWSNHGGINSVQPTTGFFYDENGRQCRKYQVKIIVDGNYETGEGKACKRPDGYWDI